MLIGQYFTKLTEKGRCALPKKFRRQLGDKAIIAKWYEGCLVVVGEKLWEVLLIKLTGKSEIITQPVRDTDRFILGSAFEFTTDSQGRFVIPKVLREYAGLKEEVVFVGLGERVEVWSKGAWSQREDYVQKHASELVEKLAKAKE
ncbi:cell division/cell wall cluster transcriptional repressor MraZ [Patescibacteria group bacterium]|nr:cell division/cell wall cluster transcriptional repressor MraZ [Patescibacteria group bacterium]